MIRQPNYITAALTGAWAGLIIPPFEAWHTQHQYASPFMSNVALLLIAAAVFVPLQIFVFGKRPPPSRAWFTNPEERQQYFALLKRILACGVVAGLALLLWRYLPTP